MAAVIPLKLILGSPPVLARLMTGDTIAASYLDPLVLTTTSTSAVSNKTFSGLRVNTTEYTDHGAILGSVSGAKVLDFAESATPDNRPRLTTGDTTAGVGTISYEFVGGATTGHIDIVPKGASGRVKFGGVEAVDLSTAQTLSNKTLSSPTVSATGWSNANHDHSAANAGGQLPAAAIGSGTINGARLGSTDAQDFVGSDPADSGLSAIKALGVAHVSECAITTAATTADQRLWIPFFVPKRPNPVLTQLLVSLTAGWGTNRKMLWAAYSNNGSTTAPRPNALVSDGSSGDVFDFDTGGAQIVTISLANPVLFANPGALHWMCLWANDSNPTLHSFPTAGVMPVNVLGFNQSGLHGLFQTGANAAPLWGFKESIAFGGIMPSTAPSLGLSTSDEGFTWLEGPRFVIGSVWSS